ncbi:MAG: orotidine-5'-phosphate decarboxylase [Candidatus Omnitrophica bacterium]|nr:orotidine-5'-phosphate decarboxylase [Candidatus Omnitrophota bacterium]
MKTEIILALDVDNFAKARNLINRLYPIIRIFKVGSQLFTACGPKIIEFINKKGGEVFLDLKFFDIPNTVSRSVRMALRHKVKMLTLHIAGGEDMMKAAISAAKDEKAKKGAKKILLVGVTVLTSKKTQPSKVIALARMGVKCGLDGVVCSVREARMLRKSIARRFIIVTPGIRPQASLKDDQRRTATVSEAVLAGSDYLVIGRPILEADDPKAAAKSILGEIYARRD